MLVAIKVWLESSYALFTFITMLAWEVTELAIMLGERSLTPKPLPPGSVRLSLSCAKVGGKVSAYILEFGSKPAF